jgi:hypothetical protein
VPRASPAPRPDRPLLNEFSEGRDDDWDTTSVELLLELGARGPSGPRPKMVRAGGGGGGAFSSASDMAGAGVGLEDRASAALLGDRVMSTGCGACPDDGLMGLEIVRASVARIPRGPLAVLAVGEEAVVLVTLSEPVPGVLRLPLRLRALKNAPVRAVGGPAPGMRPLVGEELGADDSSVAVSELDCVRVRSIRVQLESF